MATRVRINVGSFNAKIGAAFQRKGGAAAMAGAQRVVELIQRRISSWDRQPDISIVRADIGVAGGWKTLHALIEIDDPVKFDEVDRFKILEEGRDPLDHDVYAKNKSGMMWWNSPYVSKTTGESSNNSNWFGTSAKKRQWVEDGTVSTKIVHQGTRGIQPMRIASGAVQEHKTEVYQAMINAFHSA